MFFSQFRWYVGIAACAYGSVDRERGAEYDGTLKN
jgi:hypothetical protein